MSIAANKPLAVAVLISGGGTTLRNLIEQVAAGTLPIDIRLVISSSAKAGGLKFAEQAKIPFEVHATSAHGSEEAYSQAVFAACRAAGVQLVVMAGFLKFVPIPADFENRVVNIHPALIPAFCGHKSYGLHVHRAVLEYGARLSGCTVHFVDNQFDHGPIILQRAVPVLDNDTPESLAARVFAVECLAYPLALKLIAEGRVEVHGRRVTVR
jgi:phosphoribosylglycinamide formyltransferase-1